MDAATFSKLSLEQQWAMIIATSVRDAMERFHSGPNAFIPKSAMPELNRRIRYAILGTVYCLLYFRKPGCELKLDERIGAIPAYREFPGIFPAEQDYFDREDESFIGRESAFDGNKYDAWFTTGQLPRQPKTTAADSSAQQRFVKRTNHD